jgi:hypothetical protein
VYYEDISYDDLVAFVAAPDAKLRLANGADSITAELSEKNRTICRHFLETYRP